MTNEEQTIANLKKLKAFHNGSYGADIDRAIKALEQQPCEDCISREDAINELKLAYFNKDLQSAKDDPCIVDAMTDWAIRTIKKLPSITPSYNSIKTELKPSEDCVSRESVLDLAKKGVLISNGSYESVCKAINELPPVTPRTNLAESSQDCVRRESVNKLIDELARAISDERCCISRGRNTATIMQDILDLPPITPSIKEWLSSFNTESATECFTAVQELRKK